jgi:hypothetical protein
MTARDVWFRIPRFVAFKTAASKKEQLTNALFLVYVSFVTHEHPSSLQADPASHDPSGARTATCTCCGGARQPDPTDDFIAMLKEYAQLGMRLARVGAKIRPTLKPLSRKRARGFRRRSRR